jgi:hypothetical protein
MRKRLLLPTLALATLPGYASANVSDTVRGMADFILFSDIGIFILCLIGVLVYASITIWSLRSDVKPKKSILNVARACLTISMLLLATSAWRDYLTSKDAPDKPAVSAASNQ